jgi:hypothetical protein
MFFNLFIKIFTGRVIIPSPVYNVSDQITGNRKKEIALYIGSGLAQ